VLVVCVNNPQVVLMRRMLAVLAMTHWLCQIYTRWLKFGEWMLLVKQMLSCCSDGRAGHGCKMAPSWGKRANW